MRLFGKNVSETKTTAEQQAVQWFLRVQNGELTQSERAEFASWQMVEANSSAYAAVSGIWRSIDKVSHAPEVLGEIASGLAEVSRKRAYFTSGIAACIALLFLAALANSMDAVLAIMHTAFDKASLSETVFETDLGERSTVTLSDGSVLSLNTASSAHVLFDAKERKIVLARGQASFRVAKNQARPFVVYAGDRRVVATGTEFDVRLDRAMVEVTLVEGHVAVRQGVNAFDHGGAKTVDLNAGERLVAKAGSTASVVGQVDLESVTSWTSGKLVFLDMKLVDAIAEVNRYTKTPLILADAALADLRISGVFYAGQPAEFARTLAELRSVSIAYEPNGQIVISAKEN